MENEGGNEAENCPLHKLRKANSNSIKNTSNPFHKRKDTHPFTLHAIHLLFDSLSFLRPSQLRNMRSLFPSLFLFIVDPSFVCSCSSFSPLQARDSHYRSPLEPVELTDDTFYKEILLSGKKGNWFIKFYTPVGMLDWIHRSGARRARSWLPFGLSSPMRTRTRSTLVK